MGVVSSTKYYFKDFDKVLKNYSSRFYATCFYQDQMIGHVPVNMWAKIKEILVKNGCKPQDRMCDADAELNDGDGNIFGIQIIRKDEGEEYQFYSSASHIMCNDANYEYKKHKKAVLAEARILERMYNGDFSMFKSV